MSNNTDNAPNESFGLFSRLPPELRLQVWQIALTESMRHVHTVAMLPADQDQVDGDGPDAVPCIITNMADWAASPLWHVNYEARSEATHLSMLLPSCAVVNVGANTFSARFGQGTLPMQVGRIHLRPFLSSASLYFLEETVTSRLFWQTTHPMVPMLAPCGPEWLTHILICRRTFMHMLAANHVDDEPQGLPFVRMPQLRSIHVGFLHRWQDVALVEGPVSSVIRDIPGLEGSEITTEALSVLLDIVAETIQQTLADVRVLQGAGISIHWCFLRSGVSRRIDVENYYP